ncbi:hypothetical protein [Escherichia coli]
MHDHPIRFIFIVIKIKNTGLSCRYCSQQMKFPST